jgi:hypothetical protein
MKEKRIITMFITSAIALVISLVVTFGIVLTLADPVEATGLTRYAFNYKGTNDALIANADNGGLKFATDVIYTPSGSIVWKDKPASADVNDDHFIVDAQPDSNGLFDYTTVIRYGNESYSSKVKVIPFRVKNFDENAKAFTIKINAEGDATLLKYTQAKLFSYSSGLFTSVSTDQAATAENLVELNSGDYADFFLVIFTDEASNLGEGVNYGEARLNINMVIA